MKLMNEALKAFSLAQEPHIRVITSDIPLGATWHIVCMCVYTWSLYV